MNKKELVAAVAGETGETLTKTNEMVDALTNAIIAQMRQGNEVSVPGFGKFVTKHRESRQVRNPATGEMITSKAKTSVQFKPTAALKDI